MSKRNKNKYKLQSQGMKASAPADNIASPAPVKSQENLSYDMKQEFTYLGIVVIFILALLIGLYLYDKETHVLNTMTDKLFGLF
jgi:hypothetical protein